MDLWFLLNRNLLSRERESISQLQQSAGWLTAVDWSFCGGKLCADVIIKAHDHDYELRLIYPNLFPQVPPAVRPRNASDRWSEHQYGAADGPLCLEWGPDNWHPEVTGAQVLESAHKLLDIENPLGGQSETDESVPVIRHVAPSRHALNPGQELRTEFARFYLGDPTLQNLIQLPANAYGTVRFSTRRRSKTYLAVVHELQMQGEGGILSDSSIPSFFRGKDDDNVIAGVFFKTTCTTETLKAINRIDDLVNVLQTAGYDTRISIDENRLRINGIEKPPLGYLILDREDNPHFLFLFEDGSTLKFAQVISDSGKQAERTPDNLQELSAKSVGIVGLGSAGSKMAVSLARMGVRRFYLVDYDIFLPENSQRNALDWASLGDHKVDGTAEILLRLGVDFDIEVSRSNITGQESTASVSAILDRLGKCDLIIDATADSKVFNLMAGVVSIYKKSLIWLEVYGGGIGGMIARSRPGLDPDPQTMRAAYLGFCERNPAPENMRPKAANDYGVENSEGVVYTASDADVAIIAHHAARLAGDAILTETSSSYPYSMYLIGLAESWVFEAPFDTRPIATAHLLQSEEVTPEQPQSAPADDTDNNEFLISLIKKLDAASDSV